ncbi:hypothetical protein ES703_84261 [subsurface metagenome]
MFAGSFQACVKNIHVIGRCRNICGYAGPKKKVDVIQSIYQLSELIEVLKGARAGLASFKIENLYRSPSCSQMNAMFCKVKIIFPIPTIQNHPLRSLSYLFHDQVPGKGDARSFPIYCHTCFFKHFKGLVQPRFIGKACRFQYGQRGLMDGFDLFF